MALNENTARINDLIHHSDRGVQYCCADYVTLLQDNNIQISMTENGDPLENAIAERVNGIIKQEYLEHWDVNDINEAMIKLEQAVTYYNNQRPHMSCGWLTSALVHDQNLSVKREWKSYYKRKPHITQL